MKAYLILLIFILFFVFTSQGTGDSHDLEYGQRMPGDRVIYNNVIHEKYKFLQIVKKDINIATDYTISYIKIKDQYTDGHGGYASVIEGGLGFKHVVIHLKSQRNHGFNFMIEVYGH